jgi:hypothetical protein
MKTRAKNNKSSSVVTQREFQARHGISPSRFKTLVGEGLPLRGKRVDEAEAAAWLSRNVNRPAPAESGASLMTLRRMREAQKIEAGRIELAKTKGELIKRTTVQRFISERGRMERDAWIAWASAISARLAASFSVDHGKLFAAIEDEVRAQLRYLAEKPLEEPE